MCIKIPAENEKCVELLIIDNIWIKFRDLALKLFFNRCDEQCFERVDPQETSRSKDR